MSFKTIAQLNAELTKTYPKGCVGKPLVYGEITTREELAALRVSEIYQRLLAEEKLLSYGTLNLSLLIPAVISRRPSSLGDDAGDFVIDGQHKAELHFNSAVDCAEHPFPIVILNHDEDATLAEVLKAEALLFQNLNTQRKSLTKLDELRSEVVFGDEFALHIESCMKLLSLSADRFGSRKPYARTVTTFNQFYYCVKEDYPCTTVGLDNLSEGYELWEQIYGDGDARKVQVHGTAFRAVCFINEFINHGLTNGRATKFKAWCIESLARAFSQQKLVKGYGTFASPRWVLYRVIERYNDETANLSGRGAQTLGSKTLLAAANKDKKFAHPDEETWKKIVIDATK